MKYIHPDDSKPTGGSAIHHGIQGLIRIIHRQVAKDAKLLLDLILNKTHGKQCVRKMIQTRSDATFSVLQTYDLCSLGVLAVNQ